MCENLKSVPDNDIRNIRRTKMKKSLLPVLGTAALLILAACGPTENSSSSASSEKTSEETSTSSSSLPASSEQHGEPTVYPTFEDLEKEPDTSGYSISFKAPEGWDDPYLWAWTNEGGANAFPGMAWPGRLMEETADGWYQLAVPTRVDMVIIAANQGKDNAIQSEGLPIEGKDVWFDGVSKGTAQNEDGTSRDTYNLTALYEAPAGAPAAKAYVSEAYFGVHVPNAWRTANVYGVDGEGKATLIPTELDSDGYRFMGFANSDYVSYYVTDGGSRTSVNFALRKNNGNSAWFADVGEYLIDGKNEAGIVAYDTKPLPPSDTYRLEVSVPAAWTEPYLWAWNKASGVGMFSTWPGEALEKVSDGKFAYDVSTTCDQIIISIDDPNSDKEDARLQTADLAENIDTSKDTVYATVTDETDANGKYILTISYEA